MSVCRTTSVCPTEPELGLYLDGLTKVYEKRVVVDQVSLKVGQGEIFGLLGPNGAGKTTLIKMIAGLTRPTAGSVRVFGLDVSARDAQVKRWIGVMPQDNNMERELTVEETFAVYGRLFGVKPLRQQVERQLAEFGLEEMREKKIGTLSGGMARRALIARTLLPQPRLLLLDEPTVGLDPDVRHSIWEIVRKFATAGKTIILTTHYMVEAERVCGRVGILKAGRMVVEGTPAYITRQAAGKNGGPATLESVFINLAREAAV